LEKRGIYPPTFPFPGFKVVGLSEMTRFRSLLFYDRSPPFPPPTSFRSRRLLFSPFDRVAFFFSGHGWFPNSFPGGRFFFPLSFPSVCLFFESFDPFFLVRWVFYRIFREFPCSSPHFFPPKHSFKTWEFFESFSPPPVFGPGERSLHGWSYFFLLPPPPIPPGGFPLCRVFPFFPPTIRFFLGITRSFLSPSFFFPSFQGQNSSFFLPEKSPKN